MDEPIKAPDFIVVGGQYGDKVMLLASKELADVELKEELDNLDRLLGRHYSRYIEPSRYDIRLTAEMRDYVIVWGEDYPQAWQTLFECWTPENHQQELPALKELP